jgi:hypothetical protein
MSDWTWEYVPDAANVVGGLTGPGAGRAAVPDRRLAIDFVSGPPGIAALLRTGLLEGPFSTASLPLDIGYSENIPAHIRRAVALRDRAAPGPAAAGPPRSAMCTMSCTRRTAARPALTHVFYCASFTTTSVSTGGAGRSS